MEELNNIVEELIGQKDFNDLSMNEKELVLSVISEQEYELQRSVVLNAMDIMNEEAHFLSPDPSIKAKLNEALSERESPNNVVFMLDRLLNFRVPSYQVVMGMAATILVFLWLGNPDTAEIIIQEKIVYQPQVDTVYVETKIPVIEVKIVERIVQISTNESSKMSSDVSVNSFTQQRDKAEDGGNVYAYSENQLSAHQLKSMGSTSLTKKSLDQFLVVMN